MPAFQPLLGNAPNTLILGSMPSQRSLEESQYYAHPQNSFWWIMSQLIGFSAQATYQQKCESLTTSGFALWDVLHDCERRGSLDSNIQRGTEQVNDFAGFLSDAPSIKLVGFNGLAAKKIFQRHCSSLFNDFPNIEWCQLPSSSAAYASIGRKDKLVLWRAELKHNI